MKILIVEDDITSRSLLHNMLKPYGTVEVAVDGREAVDVFRGAIQSGKPFDLACVDIMMPEMDGHATLKTMRDIEKEYNRVGENAATIIMTTSLADLDNVQEAIKKRCDSYLVKPIQKDRLVQELQEFNLIEGKPAVE